MSEAAQAADRASIDRYLDDLARLRRHSPHTVSNYRRDLLRLLAHTPAPLPGLQARHIRAQIARLHGEGLSPRSITRHLSSWRGYYAWLGEQGLAAGNPCAGLRPPKSNKPLPRTLSVDEAQRLLAPPADADDLLGRRDRAMFELFYSSGLRLAELARLDLRDLDDVAASGEIRILGKRNKARIVPVGGLARQALADWEAVRGELAAADECALFVNQRGQRLGHRGIQLRLAHLGRQQSLLQHVHPHMLRHAFASHVLQSSGDLRAVQEMLGHASIASTQVYTHLDFQHLAQVYDNAHPRARRKNSKTP